MYRRIRIHPLLTIRVIYYSFVFFFSSRRRHTRYWRDWSSDVCSSDLLFGGRVRDTAVREVGGEAGAPEQTGFEPWLATYSVLQWVEIWSCLGAWVEETNPAFGPEAAQNFNLVKGLDRRQVGPAIRRREEYSRNLRRSLGPNDLLCIPTTPAPAPLKGTIRPRGSAAAGANYPPARSPTSAAGIGRGPQAALPLPPGFRGGPLGFVPLARPGGAAFLPVGVRSGRRRG